MSRSVRAKEVNSLNIIWRKQFTTVVDAVNNIANHFDRAQADHPQNLVETIIMKKALKALQHQSAFSLPPVLQADLARYKQILQDCIEERCPEDELADAYESLGLSELFLGNYTEASHNLECALVAHASVLITDSNTDHKMRLNFWVNNFSIILSVLKSLFDTI